WTKHHPLRETGGRASPRLLAYRPGLVQESEVYGALYRPIPLRDLQYFQPLEPGLLCIFLDGQRKLQQGSLGSGSTHPRAGPQARVLKYRLTWKAIRSRRARIYGNQNALG